MVRLDCSPARRHVAHDANGRAWHDSSWWLPDMMKQRERAPWGNMPAGGDMLSDDDIETIIAWLQSQWLDEIYLNWLVMDERGRKVPAVP